MLMIRRLPSPKFVTAWLVCVVVCLASMCVLGRPASALTPNENFVNRLYRDFYLRDATQAELALGAVQLQGQTRAAFTVNFLNSTPFRANWVEGVYQRYTLRSPTSSQFSSAMSSLATYGNYLSVELDALASSYYFALAGSTNREYVDALYSDLLWRVADTSGWDYWTDQLNLGHRTRRQVAEYIVRSNESSRIRVRGVGNPTTCLGTDLTNFDDLALGSYCLLLDRLADSSGAAYWTAQLEGNGQLPSLWINLASSSEYYSLAQ